MHARSDPSGGRRTDHARAFSGTGRRRGVLAEHVGSAERESGDEKSRDSGEGVPPGHVFSLERRVPIGSGSDSASSLARKR